MWYKNKKIITFSCKIKILQFANYIILFKKQK